MNRDSPQSPVSTNPQPLTPNPLYACLYRPQASDAPSTLVALAEEFSPRYQSDQDDLVTIDIRGLERLLGDPRSIGEQLQRSALARGLRAHIGIATTRTTAMVMALARPGLTVVPRGNEAAAIAAVAIGILDRIADQPPSPPGLTKTTPATSPGHRSSTSPQLNAKDSVIPVMKRWGLQTLGELAALPSGELSARLGRQGLVWQAIARGQDVGPLVPTLASERFESSIELEWPIEGLEPLSFVLTRLLEPLSTRLERRDRGAAAIHVRLGLVATPDINHREHRDTKSFVQDAAVNDLNYREHRSYRESRVQNSVSSVAPVVALNTETYTRSLQLPSPIRDVRALRTLILLDLEAHAPAAPIERVTVTIDPTPGRVLQHALFVRALPTPEQLSTLIARLNALMGADRVGRPARVDSYRPGAFAMQPFATEHSVNHREHRAHRDSTQNIDHQAHQEPFVQNSANSVASVVNVASALTVVSALRRCRQPVPARVVLAGDRPVTVTTDRRGFAGGRVLACAGPWRSSGEWWAAESSWNRDEWDVSLSDGGVYRIFQDRDATRWFIEAIVD